MTSQLCECRRALTARVLAAGRDPGRDRSARRDGDRVPVANGSRPVGFARHGPVVSLNARDGRARPARTPIHRGRHTNVRNGTSTARVPIAIVACLRRPIFIAPVMNNSDDQSLGLSVGPSHHFQRGTSSPSSAPRVRPHIPPVRGVLTSDLRLRDELVRRSTVVATRAISIRTATLTMPSR
jgi:hypothetical protein